MARQFANRRTRPAFTLVELLVVLAVLSMMASLVLVGLASAAEQAKAARTRSQIQRIHELLMTRWDDYKYRRVEANKTGNMRVRQAARLNKIRELMRIEMPDRKSDVADGPVSLDSVPGLQFRYQRVAMARTNTSTFTAADAAWSSANENAECLYLILESIQDGETNGLDFFKESEIGDTDGDGMFEILDGWGNPIIFLRWPFGYPIIEPTGVRRDALSSLNDLSAPDPFDPLGVLGGKTTVTTTPLVYEHPIIFPLIFSAGPDGLYNIRTSPSTTYQASLTTPPNNPYFEDTSFSPATRMGMILDDSGDELDNITNHQLVVGGNE
ncbi:prepilin-type N-terminal cleavage/methylation domain-containing protein [Bremerella sp. JC817]|uniref:prepilin-type N-terminal cleavage/methylation domain-containing protein n=1 Tax=Bremerella sp. JC817 TaxID=3231756 RepID=UPI003457452F